MQHSSRRRRGRARLSMVAIWAAAAWTLSCSPSTTEPDPGSGGAGRGILLITVDGLVAGDLQAFGGTVPSPNLGGLIGEGRGWPDAWTTCPMTRPAVASYLTGLTPDRHGIWNDFADRLSPATPTLASLLGDAGYRTAAFPDAARLGLSSDLLDGFQIVDAPPPSLPGIQRWRRELRPADEQAAHFATWVGSVGDDENWFAWIHTTTPLMAQMSRTESEWSQALEAFDGWLGQILETLATRDDQVAIALAGTFANTRGTTAGAAGVGLSVAPPAVSVPLVLRLPGGASPPAGAAVWAPDVPRTLLALAGLSGPAAEGLDLRVAHPEGRSRWVGTAATREELGWRPAAAVSIGTRRLRSDQTAGPDDADLAQALAARTLTLPDEADPELLDALRRSGLDPRPLPRDGRPIDDAARRLAVAHELWAARVHLQHDEFIESRAAFERLSRLDPHALAALLDFGQLLIAMGENDPAKRLLRKASELYPDDPETVHWFVHATWGEDHERAETLLRLILPQYGSDSDLLYDLACLRSLAGDLEASESFLREAIDAGFEEWEHLQTDPDLRTLRESDRFAVIMRELRQ